VAKQQRGRESAGDMIRSLTLVLGIVVVVFFLAQAPRSDKKSLRVVDPSSDVQAFDRAVPGGAVPRAMPAGWRSTVSSYEQETGLLRIGWVTPKGRYAEYAAQPAPAGSFLADITDRAERVGTVDIDGATWTEYRKGDAISLVRSYGTTLVVVGTLRDTAALDELRVVAGRLAA
jgi:hypothetical protein